jgi:large subunit ribosomal protein L33
MADRSGYNAWLRFPAHNSVFRPGLARRENSAMAKGRAKKKAETVFLVCEETGDYNYSLRRKPGGEKLKLKKYSPRLRKHTLHVEKKK